MNGASAAKRAASAFQISQENNAKRPAENEQAHQENKKKGKSDEKGRRNSKASTKEGTRLL